jgi:hypothetical protein
MVLSPAPTKLRPRVSWVATGSSLKQRICIRKPSVKKVFKKAAPRHVYKVRSLSLIKKGCSFEKDAKVIIISVRVSAD